MTPGIIAFFSGCATPLPPSGGPEDTTPPILESSHPEHEAVLVSTDRITLTFSERLDPGSVARAVQLSPRLGSPPDVRARGREVDVRLEDSLRHNTTYLLTLSTDLRDNHGVALREPITIAFSTGPTIDHGRLEGTVRDPISGDTQSGLSILAIPQASSDSLPNPTHEKTVYETETGADGRFSLRHIHPDNYFVYALRDRNRNGLADDGEPFALPNSLPLPVDTLARELTLFITTVDTLAPELRTSETLSSQRVRLRFSESVSLNDETLWAAVDSASGEQTKAYAYQLEPSSPTVFAWTEEALSPGTYRFQQRPSEQPEIVVDSLGNPNTLPVRFSTEDAPSDTARVRFRGFEPAATDSITRFLDNVRAVFSIPPNTALPEIQLFIRPKDDARIEPAERTSHGIDRILGPQPGLTFQDRFQAEIVFPDTTHSAFFAQMTSEEVGGIVGRVEDDPPAFKGANAIVVARGPNGDLHPSPAASDGSFAIQRLPPGVYSIFLYIDQNENGRWDGGLLSPFEPPEPVRHLAEPVTVRARWDTDIETIRITPSSE